MKVVSALEGLMGGIFFTPTGIKQRQLSIEESFLYKEVFKLSRTFILFVKSKA